MMQVDTGRHPRTPPVAQLLVALLGAGRAPSGRDCAMPVDAWGITDAYDDSRGERRRTPAVTRQALRAAMGGDSADPRPPGDAPVVVVTRGSGAATLAPGEL